jgi:hypothetical protein
MDEKQTNQPEQPTETHEFYRELHPSEEDMLAGLLEAHPTLTRQKALEMLEAAGF